jgi:hypothetical protein
MRLYIPVLALVACTGPAVDGTSLPITASTPASPVTRGYAVFLDLQYQNGDTGTCSGTLVDDDLVLTAAHCSRCTVGGVAYVLGTSTHGPGVKPDDGVAIVQAFTHPDAFPAGAIDCTESEGSVRHDMEATIRVANDMGLVRLDKPISGSKAKVLVHPPLGFEPVSDLADDTVTLIGRGPTTVGSSATNTMNEGVANVDAYDTDTLDMCGVPPSPVPYLQLENDGGEANLQGGDSGGPLVVTWYGQPYVLGVASWYCNEEKDDVASYYAPTFTAEAIAFLAPHLGWADSSDPDGDHVPSGSDNCPDVGNTDQADAEGDGVGDVCDLCPQAADLAQANCNAEAELATGAKPRGDACDPHACPGVEVVYGAPPDGLVDEPVLWPICGVTGEAIASCHYEMPVALRIAPTLDDVATGDTGFRFCECADPHDTVADRAAHCGDTSAWDCAIDGARYDLPDPAWSGMAVDGAGPDPLTSATFQPAPAKVLVPFDMVANLEAIAGPLPGSAPYPVVDGALAGVALDGIAWAHAVSVGGTSTVADDRASGYVALDHRVRTVTTWKKIPQYAPAFPWTYCAQCIVETPWLDIYDGWLRVAVGAGDAYEITDRVDTLAAKLLDAGLRRVPASEPEAALFRAGVARRELVVDDSLARVGALSVNEKGIAGETFEAPTQNARSANAPRDALLAYAAIDDILYALSPEGLWRDDGRGWARVKLDAALGTPLAMTYRRLDDALYVLDRDREGTVRLVQIDLRHGRASVTAGALTRLQGGTFAILASDTGDLLLAAGFDGRTELAYVTAGPRAALVATASPRHRWTAGLVEMRGAIHLLEPIDGGFAPRALRRDELRTARRGDTLAPLWR